MKPIHNDDDFIHGIQNLNFKINEYEEALHYADNSYAYLKSIKDHVMEYYGTTLEEFIDENEKKIDSGKECVKTFTDPLKMNENDFLNEFNSYMRALLDSLSEMRAGCDCGCGGDYFDFESMAKALEEGDEFIRKVWDIYKTTEDFAKTQGNEIEIVWSDFQ